jgi:hypothetical protein
LLTAAFAAAVFPAGAHRTARLAFTGGASNRRAAAAAGFEIVEAGFDAALADRSVDAVFIAGPVSQRAHLAMEACTAQKDVWVEAPVCASLAEGRRMVAIARQHRRVVQAGTVWRSSRPFQAARRAVRGGELGGIVYCRASEGTASSSPTHLVDLLQCAFNEAVPRSIAAQGNGGNLLATFHYPGFVASYERRGASPAGIAFHGAHATRTVCPHDHGARIAHWRNFLECIRSRRRPISDIGTAVRSTATHWLTDLALRRGTSISFEMETNLS